MADEITTQILIEIRDEIRGTNTRLDETAAGLNARIDETNEKLAVLAMLTRGIDTRMSRMEAQNVFVPRRLDVLEQKVARIEEELKLDD